ncbi:MAG: DUF1854 domain-containing protein [candidate division KSB1 bacterium]|nr:DUF1854 domain-containing protein [candidate division KSB1 bacterium]MDZ7333666.1 DUF1854 domain-containing protein [candidate division KSB1 bacterium]MDZ7356114.1 DUF1854 domain-containing protein [candidate division KSB1 bacterium]MDZ7398909.1 DUF1854 domain-containing protein [candidate division KSB1 bacterium]
MIKILQPDELNFEQKDGGFLRLKLANGTIHEPISCVPLFPLSNPTSYIALVVKRNGTTEEVGVIHQLNDLSPAQRPLVEREIQLRYFCPRILDIHAISSKYGVDQWDVTTDCGKKRFLVQDAKENVTIRDDGLIMIIDTEGCRYQVRDYRQLPTRARIRLEQALL